MDAGFSGERSYVIQKCTGYYMLDRNVDGTDDAGCIQNYLDTTKTTSQSDIQARINDGYSMRWNTPVINSSPAPEVHNWTHGVIYPATENSDGLEGDYCTICSATRNTSPIPAGVCIIDNRIQQVEWASPAKVSILEMTTLCSLPNYFMKMIDAKKNCDFTMRFTYNKKHYEVYIPAGTQFDNSLDWYGPEQLLAMFEYKELY